jgi:hypothetical protein
MEQDELPAAATPKARVPWWRRLLPVVVAVGLVGFVLARQDLDAFLNALARTNYFVLASFAVVFVLSLLSADAFATSRVYRATVAPVDFKSLFLLRGASYLPSMLNHHLGQAWLTYFLSKAYRAPLWRVAGATLLVYATLLGGLVLLTLGALPLGGGRNSLLLPVLIALVVLGLGYLVVFRLRPSFLAERQALAPLFEVGVLGHLKLLLFRSPHLFVLFVGHWWLFLLFDVNIPLNDALAMMPVLMFVSSLPLAPQGFGTRDVLALELFRSYASGTVEEQTATIAAATLSFGVSVTVIQLVVSPLLMARAYKLLGVQTPAPVGETP